MINTNKRWLLTASPWMKYGLRLSSLGIRSIFLIAVLVFGNQVSNAQGHYGYFGWGGGGLPSLPVITGNTTICPGTTTALSNTTPGGIWSSSNTAIATVGATGLVAGVQGGFVNINYTVGLISIGTMVTVTYPIMGSASVCVGNNTFLIDSTPTGIWSSSNPGVANVLPSGELDGIVAGTATISYGRTGACQVQMAVTTSANGTAPIGGTGTLGVCVGGTITATDATPSGSWNTSNATLATVNSSTGVINGLAAGAVTLTYTSGGCYVTKPLAVSSSSSIAAITGGGSVCLGNKIQLSDATPMGTWSSSNSAIAYVNTAGTVTANGIGSAIISYNKTGCSVTHSITVNANTVAPITGNTNICIGQTTSLTDATTGGAWSSSDNTLATVVGGVVTGVAAGSPLITYAIISTGCFQTAAVVVNSASVVGPLSGTNSVCQGTMTTLSDAVPGGTWSTGSPSVATVSAFGTVTGLASGTATITYTRLGCAALDVVTVNPLPVAITGSRKECAVNTGTTTTLSDASAGGAWSIANTAYATINSSTGLVTGVAPGVVTVTYALPTGCYVTATDTAYGPPAISGGTNACIAPLVYLYLSEPATLGGAWSSKTTSIATISGTGSTGAVTGVAPGIDTIKYTVNYSGLSCYVSQPVTVNFDPGIISGYLTACAGGTTLLADTTAGGAWSSANTTIATVGSAGVVAGVATGGVIISYTKNGCTRTANITVAAPPAAITGNATVCVGLATITLSDATTGGTWSANNPDVSIAQTSSTTALVTGVTAGAVTISYAVGGCAVTKTITAGANGVTSLAGLPIVCTGLTTTLSSGGGAGAWTSGNTSIASFSGSVTNASAAVLGVSAGTTVITYTRSSDGCFKTSVFAVNTQPAAINGATTICNAATTILTDDTSGGAWSSSDARTAAVNTSGVVTGITFGRATITYAMPGGCQSFQPMNVTAMPSAYVGASAVCAGAVAAVYDSLPGGAWLSSNTSVATIVTTGGVSASVTGIIAGTTTITYTVGACYVSKTFTVGNVTPTFTSGPVSVCANGTASPALTVSNAGGAWTSGNALVASVSSGAITGVAAGTVSVTYTLNGCFNQQVETVFADTMAPITGNTVVCVAGSTTLADAASGGTWSTANTTFATVNSSTGLVTGQAAGSVIMTYTMLNGGCKQWLSMNVGNVTPVAMTGNIPVCAGSTFTVSDATVGGAWIVDNNAVAYVNTSGVVAGVSAGTANLSYTLVGCYATQVVTVNPLPVAIAGTAIVCEGNVIALTDATASGTWSSTTTAVAVDASGNVTGMKFGTPTIKYTITATGCFTGTVVTVGGLNPTLSGPTSLCSGSQVTIATSKSGGTWVSGSTGVASIISGVLTGITGGVDTVYYTNPGCPTVTYTDTVNYVAQIAGSATMCQSDSMTLTDATGGGIWSTSNTSISVIGSGTGLLKGTAGGFDTVVYTVAFTGLNCSVTKPMWLDGACKFSGGPNTITNQPQVYTLFPNPSSGNINIAQNVPVDGTMQVSILNYVGAKVYSGSIVFSGGKGQLNISAASGMYLVLLQDQKGVIQTFKVLIEKY